MLWGYRGGICWLVDWFKQFKLILVLVWLVGSRIGWLVELIEPLIALFSDRLAVLCCLTVSVVAWAVRLIHWLDTHPLIVGGWLLSWFVPVAGSSARRPSLKSNLQPGLWNTNEKAKHWQLQAAIHDQNSAARFQDANPSRSLHSASSDSRQTDRHTTEIRGGNPLITKHYSPARAMAVLHEASTAAPAKTDLSNKHFGWKTRPHRATRPSLSSE